jgi:hypothetical protein
MYVVAVVFVFVQVFERVSSLVKVDPSQGHRPLAGFSVTIADCGAMPASYRSPVHGAALRNELAATPLLSVSAASSSSLHSAVAAPSTLAAPSLPHGSTLSTLAVFGASATTPALTSPFSGISIGSGVFGQGSAAAASSSAPPSSLSVAASASDSVSAPSPSQSRRFVYLLVQVRVPGGSEDFSERVVVELFDDVVPKTAENFRCLCTGERVRAAVVGAVEML